MNWTEFERLIAKGQYQSVYLFTGPEELKKKEAVSNLRQALLPPGLEQLNEAVLENCSAQDIIDAAETLPFMCERRLILVRDWAPALTGRAKNEEEDTGRMIAYLENPPDTAAIVFYYTKEFDKRKKFCKFITAIPGAVVFDYLQGPVLAKWCAEQLAPMHKKLQLGAFTLMTAMAGTELTRLTGELQKLAAYVEDAPEITPEDVRRVVTPTGDYRAYEILDKLLSGDLAGATENVKAVLLTGMPAVGLIVMLANTLRVLAHIRLGTDSGKSADAVIAALGEQRRGYFLKKQSRLLTAQEFTDRYLCCTQTQYEITSGSVRDRAALDALLLKLVVPKTATKRAFAASKR